MNAGGKRYAVMDLVKWKWVLVVHVSVLVMLAPTHELLKSVGQIEGKSTLAVKFSLSVALLFRISAYIPLCFYEISHSLCPDSSLLCSSGSVLIFFPQLHSRTYSEG